jgi:hypothetical protein
MFCASFKVPPKGRSRRRGPLAKQPSPEKSAKAEHAGGKQRQAARFWGRAAELDQKASGIKAAAV